jgi:membrane-bound serine protease (ClpP class)
MHIWIAAIPTIGLILLFTAIAGVTTLSSNSGIWIVLMVAAVISILIGIWMVYAAARAQYIRVKTGKEALMGSHGITTKDLKPKGEIRVLGEFWQAKSMEGTIPKDQPVQVVGMDGMFLLVKTVEEKA